MSVFVVSYLGLIALALLLVPLVMSLYREIAILSACLREARNEVAQTLRQTFHYRHACEQASDGMVVQDMQGRIVWCNTAYCKMHGRTEAEILGRNPLEFALPPDQRPTREEIGEKPFDIAEGQLHRFLNQRGTGELFWIELNASFHHTADGRDLAIVISRDVTDLVENEEKLNEARDQLSHEATHDSLTGVPNRNAVMQFLSDKLKTRESFPLAVMHVDLDNFKDINDTHGHSAGDAVLVRAADMLQREITDEDMVARVGGDEFVVVCPNVANLKELEARTGLLQQALSKPFHWSNRILHCEASIGAALSSSKLVGVETLLLQSDFALYEAKRNGRNQVALYDEALHIRHSEQSRRAIELVDVIEENKLSYYFQPTMNLHTGAVTAFETLVRWDHPKEGVIPPDQFLPIVDELGLMGALDLHSMAAALKFKSRLNKTGLGHIGINFNASPALLSHPDFINRLVWGVESAGIDRGQVAIEVLETTHFGEDTETVSNSSIIKDLRAAGFQVLLDDFGIGYAGLTHLAQLSITGVKIDRGLVTHIHSDDTSLKIVRKIIELSNDLGLKVIAEGIEDAETSKLLHDMGCQDIQGYWLSRPIPQDEVERWLADQGASGKRQSA